MFISIFFLLFFEIDKKIEKKKIKENEEKPVTKYTIKFVSLNM